MVISNGPVFLTADAISNFRNEGFLVPSYRLPKDLLQEILSAYDTLLSLNPNMSRDFILGPHLEKSGQQLMNESQRWLTFARNPKILDMVAQLIGEDIILWGMTIFGKPADRGLATPWHQDGAYYPIRPLETLSVWIALDDANLDNGCLRFIPRSHKSRSIFTHHLESSEDLTINRVCNSEYYDESGAHDLIMEAGQISFHDVYMIHGSAPNRSRMRRAALVLRLMPGHCHYDHALGKKMLEPHADHNYGKRPLYLLRGRDVSGKNDFSIGHE